MDQKQDIDTKIGNAWKAHYDGQNDVAVERFLQLLNEVPDHIDAFWGLGLSYRNLGDQRQALEAFQRVKQLVTMQLETETGQLGRYFMLNRMVDQQIEQMDEFLK